MRFKRYVCWQADQVHQILNPDAEDVANEVFLAVHSENLLWMVDPNDPQKRWSQQPQGFLKDFLDPNRTHVQAAVTGDSGSGKSHLIHWMRLNIPHRDEQYLLSIPRSGTSLRGILERVIRILPEDRRRKYQERLDMTGYHAQDHVQGRERLLDEIALAIQGDRPSAESRDPQTESWLIDNLPHLFHDPYYRQHYAPEQAGIIDQLVQHVTETPHKYHRIAERRAFRREDLPRSGVDLSKMSELARDFFGPLLSAPEYLDMSVEIINRNLDAAIGRMLNFTGDQLIELMQDVRHYLYIEGKKLILLIEDFARMQGIDTALLQALIESSRRGGRGLCELRWAMAVTTGYYERLPNTVQTRMSFVVDMDLPVRGSNALIQDGDIVAFASRYLNAVRLGAEQLEQWYHRAVGTGQLTNTPNSCERCEHRPLCHSSFGHVNGIGLYPFTKQAILNMARHKGVMEEGFNPRRLIKDVLAEVLDGHRAEFANGTFPSDLLRQKMVEQGRGLAPAQVNQLRRRDPSHYQRQRVVLELWGELEKPTKLPHGLYEALDLPVPRVEEPSGSETEADAEALTTATPPETTIADRRIVAVRNWANGANMPEREMRPLQELIYDAVVSYIDWDAHGLERSYFARRTDGPFRQRFIAFRNQQTTVNLGAVGIIIPLEEEADDLRRAALAIEGLLQFSHHKNWSFPDAEQCLVALGECLEEWSAAVLEQIGRLPDGHTEWNPVPMGVELLAIGAALGGRPATPQSDSDEFIDSLFEEWPEAAPALSAEWAKLYDRIRRKRDTLRGIVRARASGTKGGVVGGFVDAAAIILPLQELQRTWVPCAATPTDADSLRDPYASMVQLHSDLEHQLRAVLRKERELQVGWLHNVRKHIAPDQEQSQIVESLQDVRDAAVAAGLRLDWRILRRFDAARSEFEQVELTKTLEKVSALEASEPLEIPLPGLVSDLDARNMRLTSEFADSATALLSGIERAIDLEVRALERQDQGNVTDLQRQIRTDLEALERVLTTLGES